MPVQVRELVATGDAAARQGVLDELTAVLAAACGEHGGSEPEIELYIQARVNYRNYGSCKCKC